MADDDHVAVAYFFFLSIFFIMFFFGIWTCLGDEHANDVAWIRKRVQQALLKQEKERQVDEEIDELLNKKEVTSQKNTIQF